jgi:hypothetical protein
LPDRPDKFKGLGVLDKLIQGIEINIGEKLAVQVADGQPLYNARLFQLPSAFSLPPSAFKPSPALLIRSFGK